MGFNSIPGSMVPGTAQPGQVTTAEAPPVDTVKFRRTLSEAGTRAGARQMVS